MATQLTTIEFQQKPPRSTALWLSLCGFYLVWTLWAILLIHLKNLDHWPIRLAARMIIWGGFVLIYGAIRSNPLRELRLSWRGIIWGLAASSLCMARLAWQCHATHRLPALPDTGTIANAIIAGPILEELVFRAIVFREMSTRIGTASAAVISAVLFALIHLPYWTLAGDKSPAALASSLAGVFLLGVVLPLIYRWSATLLAPIILHMLNNLASLA